MEAKVVNSVSSQVKEWICRRLKMTIYKERIQNYAILVFRTFWNVGRDDPRRVIHAFKVGFSVTLASLMYFFEPLFDGVAQNAIWAVMTVVVVLEFTAGATLCKGLNRGFGTVIAGSLAFLIQFVANNSNHVFHAIFIGFAIFLMGTSATYIRFIPYIKKNYEYGVVIFLLTFNFIAVSSYRINDVLKIAQEQFCTIASGCGICLLMSFFIFPNWSGEDLHNSTVSKLEGLSISIQACVQQYFSDSNDEAEEGIVSDDPIYKAVLDSKSADETLALYASWEPRLSYGFKFPWKQYVKIGAVLRHFGYTVAALHGCLHSEIQTPKAVRAMFEEPCIRLAAEVSKVLTELANSIKDRRQCSPLSILSHQLHETLHDLDTAFKSQPRLFFNDPHPTLLDNNNKVKEGGGELRKKIMLRPTTSSKVAITSLEFAEALPFAAFASLLVEIVARLDHVIEEVEELGRVAHFKDFRQGDGIIIVNCGDDNNNKVISDAKFQFGESTLKSTQLEEDTLVHNASHSA